MAVGCNFCTTLCCSCGVTTGWIMMAWCTCMQACLAFVKREFPEYLDAYRGLAKDVERSDFFRWVSLFMSALP